MTDPTDSFWRELRRRRVAAEGIPTVDPEEAERRMEEAGGAAWSDDRLDQMVSDVTGEDPGIIEGPKPGPRPAAKRPFPLFKAAAMVIGAFGLLGVSAVIIQGSLWPESRYSTKTLDYATAIQILVDESEESGRRESAAAIVFYQAGVGIDVLVQAREQGGELAAVAAAGLDALRALPTDGQFTLLEFDRPMEVLKDQVGSRSLSVGARGQRLEELGTLVAYGLQAMNAARQTNATEQLHITTTLLLDKLAKKLAR